MNQETALRNIRDLTALWYVEQADASDIVFAACDLLVAGLDGPAMCALAAVSIADADAEVPELLADALSEVGVECLPRYSQFALRAGLRAMAARTVTGDLAPRALAAWAHRTFGHDTPQAEVLATLDDEYDLVEAPDLVKYAVRTRAELDQRTLAEAHRLSSSDR
ncbi:hypothetical protein [Pseudonocardia spinosispora]|uniref:hypothetical protein n=1 Tax=Pseudonocardia spinosispora TaxID=103441 RepID=UPI00041950AF|nr:hypothetical protein [Pseudonocardia spinosispora]